ncbi:hypothetical protein PG991_007713 [Apiospora marii]|uniref:F-box domain-containing protein n=1 Tax=Apiospora marii TaxID=335849 RepID=A0ABR1RU91_9PEZI
MPAYKTLASRTTTFLPPDPSRRRQFTMPRRIRLLDLPVELLILIVGRLKNFRDIVAVTQLNRRSRAIFSYLIVDRAVANYRSYEGRFEDNTDLAFVEAVWYDSPLMIRVLTTISAMHDLQRYGEDGRLTCIVWDSYEPLFGTLSLGSYAMGYSLAALIHDAPHVASQLLEKGAKFLPQDVDDQYTYDDEIRVPSYQDRVPGHFLVLDEVERFRDLIPLLLALEKPRGVTQNTLNAALRIACCYHWPRTVSYFLAHGADPNAFGRNGTAAIHLFALELNRVAIDERQIPLPYRGRPSSAQSFAILSALLTFGAEPKLVTRSPMYQGPQVHACRPQGCLKRVDPLVHLPDQGAVLYIARRFVHDLAVDWVVKRRGNADSAMSAPLHNLLDVFGPDRQFDLAFTIDRVPL